MAAPSGYVALDLVGFTDKGNYAEGNTYVKNDLVHSNNKIFLSLQDNNTGQALPVSPETETSFWKLWLSGGADSFELITAKDTDNLTGEGAGAIVIAQDLIDAIVEKYTEVNSNLNWKNVGSVSNKTALSLPESYKEVAITAYINGSVILFLNLPRSIIQDNTTNYGSLARIGTNILSIRISLSKSSVKIADCYINDIESSDSADFGLSAYYR